MKDSKKEMLKCIKELVKSGKGKHMTLDEFMSIEEKPNDPVEPTVIYVYD